MEGGTEASVGGFVLKLSRAECSGAAVVAIAMGTLKGDVPQGGSLHRPFLWQAFSCVWPLLVPFPAGISRLLFSFTSFQIPF